MVDADKDIVSRREYLTLVDRVAALERMLAGPRPGPAQSTPRTLPGQQAAVSAARAFALSPALSSQAFSGYYSFDSRPGQSSRAPAGGGGGDEPRTVVVGGMEPQPVHGGGDQTVGGFYGGMERIATGFGGNASGRSDSMSTMRRTSSLTAVSSGGPAESAYGTDAAAANAAATATAAAAAVSAGAGNPAALVAYGHGHPQHHHQHQHHLAGHHQHGHGQAEASSSQQPSNAMMRERWEQGVEAGEVMNYFSSGGSGDDISKFLNMDSQ